MFFESIRSTAGFRLMNIYRKHLILSCSPPNIPICGCLVGLENLLGLMDSNRKSINGERTKADTPRRELQHVPPIAESRNINTFTRYARLVTIIQKVSGRFLAPVMLLYKNTHKTETSSLLGDTRCAMFTVFEIRS
ncbi:Uncharacterized protein APZ42_017909 [Daphnia magna]|uniref:Uncharacterized protein n=1 Tax=Daphnia magna TaxID=35525 RepID=A0A164ZE03_9CRUS|nr:Uncharacterized protein APZ42_017909 [Daphnia magna]